MIVARYIPTNVLTGIAVILMLYTVYKIRSSDVTRHKKYNAGAYPYSDSKGRETSGIVDSSIRTKVVTLSTEVNFLRPSSPSTKNNVWQEAKDREILFEMYLFSSYYDNRKTIEHPTVRIMAVTENATRDAYCLLWSTDKKPVMVAAVRAKAGAWYLRHGVKLQGEVLSCGVPDAHVPDFVSIILTKTSQPTNYLKVNVPETLDIMYDFGVCINTVYGKIEPYHLVEWLESLKLFGVTEITLYNNSISEDNAKVITDYVNNGLLVVHQAPNAIDDEGEDTAALSTAVIINDCMYRNLYRYRAVLSTDFEELIVPRVANDYLELLSDIQRLQPSQHPATAYSFRTAYFYLDLPTVVGPSYLVTQTHPYRVSAEKFGMDGRSLTSPQSCVVLQKNMCWKLVAKYDRPGWLVDVDMYHALNQRYVYCALDDFYNEPGLCANRTGTIYRDESMLNFADSLIEKSSEALFRLDMEEEVFGTSMTRELANLPEGLNLPGQADAVPEGDSANADVDKSQDGGVPNQNQLNQNAKLAKPKVTVETVLNSLGDYKEKVLEMMKEFNNKKNA